MESVRLNIMVDTNLGATTVAKVWEAAKLKGHIPKAHKLKVTGLDQSYKDKKAGKTLKRVSGSTYTGPKPEEKKESQPTLEHTAQSEENSELTPKEPSTSGKSEANGEITTSVEKMRLELKTGLGDINARLKKVEHDSTTTPKPSSEGNQDKPPLIDLTQPPAHEQSSDTNPEEKTNPSDKKTETIPKGHSRVKLPSTDGKEHIEILPDAPLATNNGWKVVFDNQDALVNPPLLVTAFAICLTSS